MRILVSWITNALIILVVSQLLPDVVVDNFVTALAVAVVLGILNAILKPILILLTLPVTLLTLGLFTFVINAFILWLVANFVPGFEILNFTTAFIASLLISLFSWAVNMLT